MPSVAVSNAIRSGVHNPARNSVTSANTVRVRWLRRCCHHQALPIVGLYDPGCCTMTACHLTTATQTGSNKIFKTAGHELHPCTRGLFNAHGSSMAFNIYKCSPGITMATELVENFRGLALARSLIINYDYCHGTRVNCWSELII